MSKIKKNFVIENLEVVDISTEGKAIAKNDGLVVFIEGAVPGDVVDVMVHRKKNSFAEGKVHQMIKLSEHRVKPICEHFGTCGGCKWQNLSYATQLQFKQKYVFDAFTRIGKLDFPALLPILGNEKEYFYRNKLEFSFSNKKWLTKEQMDSEEIIENKNALGFHIPGMFDKILAIDKCYLQEEPSNSIRNKVRDYAHKHKLTFFDIRNKSGLLRTLMIRTTSTGEIMVVVSVFEWLEKELFALLDFMKTEFPQITCLQYTHNDKGNDTFFGLDIKTYYGRDHILEEMEGLKFKISAKSFYQTNSEQAYNLYKITRDFAELTGSELVYDLYTGTGTIANFVARNAKKVIGIEYVEDAIKDAVENSKSNNIHNTLFFAGNMKDVLNEDFVQTHGKPDVIISDPPRAGMDVDVVNVILKALPKKVVYVSCNPSTQARDLALMQEHYKIIKSQAVDMFPQTAHVENVVLLERI
ncbi:23S rRNA (uracil(1939)-C(5))-methyltransferase RlmD [Aurantibacillus circumpalustris]|uniref:23S rRNA (uracil(1939)-C(5))-methyltransferase RlmD n=1 Tax=Aurantibacillus circumpalustris TaxID=3036359 RepID=UPI00295BF5ED|nr:23S rRNA (uracil(1939)-C(5))-methyltransferase RlmD [Aurantibacillus circumpalustris]